MIADEAAEVPVARQKAPGRSKLIFGPPPGLPHALRRNGT